MMFREFFKDRLIIILPLIAFVSLIYISGCDDSGVETKENPVDTNVVIYKGLAAFYWFGGSNDTSYMGVNLLEGDSVRQISTIKDMELIDSANSQINYYFRSGDMSLLAIGLKTRFNRVSDNMETTKFDTLSVIPDSDSNLTPLDFVWNDTYGIAGAWGYFNFGQTNKPVYSFYLQGRNTSGTNYIYGVFHVSRIEQVSSITPPSNGVKISIDIKLNKAGKNDFKP